MSAFQFRLNPPFGDLPRCSALLNGVAQRYRVEQYRTTLSLKSVSRGAALYTTRHGRHLVTEDSFLILNHGQEYSLEFQGPSTTETLSPFFQRGFVEHVADSLATPLSPYHFHRMFKLAFRQTPVQFLQECRLAAARRLLVATDQPVTTICLAVGFESLGSFSWLFRKRFGHSPRQFRVQRREC